MIPVASILVALVIASIPASRWLARRTGAGRGVSFIFFLGGAGVLAATLPYRINYYGFLFCEVHGLFGMANLWDPQNYLNTALYVPPAFFGYLVFRRPVVLALGLAAGSAVIEALQMFSDRVCSTTDFTFNVIGSVVGIAAARILTTALQKLRYRSDERRVDTIASRQ
ncbi:VanZ family protein [Sphaerisporangium viridialbum]|uniref:VanZ family protein n=1 Tax=Sphaerisporangium viridialbum TaxID=46189 RepID=UPI003C71130A